MPFCKNELGFIFKETDENYEKLAEKWLNVAELNGGTIIVWWGDIKF